MPIKPEYKPLYGKHWKQLSYELRSQRAGWQCEWCKAKHGEAHPITGAKVVLTVAHLDQNPAHNDRANLAALCQRCQMRSNHISQMDITILFYREQEEGTHQLGDEQFELAEDTRHGKAGFRVVRRPWNGSEYSWDEDYQFYESLDAFYQAFMAQNYEQGIADF